VLGSRISITFKKIYEEEGALDISVAEDEVLVIFRTALSIEVNVE
jgi:hypothetical protein